MELSFHQYKTAVNDYLTNYCIEKGFVENTTIQRKKETFNRLTNFLDGRSFNIENVKAFQTAVYACGLEKPSSRGALVNILRAFVAWCYKYAELFEKDWSYKIIKPKVPKKKWHLLSEENALKVIIEGCTPNFFDNGRIREAKLEHLLALQFILLHGFRVGEVIAMKGSDIRLDAEVPYIILRKPKSQEEEWLPIHSHFIPILKERVEYDRVFRVTKKTILVP